MLSSTFGTLGSGVRRRDDLEGDEAATSGFLSSQHLHLAVALLNKKKAHK